MRRVALALFGTVTGLVMLLGFKTHPQSAALPAAVSTSGTGGSGTSGSSGGATPAASGTAAGTSKTGTRTVTGNTVDTQWGPVQVRITVTNGKITAAQAVNYPNNNSLDQQINSFAIPALNQEAVSAGSAQIDAISGATVTSGGYIGSLQSAIDKAGL